MVASKVADRDGDLEIPNSGGTGTPVWLVEGGRVAVTIATRAELQMAAKVLDSASTWAEQQGFVSWPRPFPVGVLEASLALGETYLARFEGYPIGTFALHRSDPTFWPDRADDPPDRARYLHKLAVGRGYPSLGRLLVQLAESIARNEGATFLRLDCVALNLRLRRYYQDLGFQHCADIDVPGLDSRMSLYEKELI